MLKYTCKICFCQGEGVCQKEACVSFSRDGGWWQAHAPHAIFPLRHRPILFSFPHGSLEAESRQQQQQVGSVGAQESFEILEKKEDFLSGSGGFADCMQSACPFR
jgi:hypothetical protein